MSRSKKKSKGLGYPPSVASLRDDLDESIIKTIIGPIALREVYHPVLDIHVYIFGDLHAKVAKCKPSSTKVKIDVFIDHLIKSNPDMPIDVYLEVPYITQAFGIENYGKAFESYMFDVAEKLEGALTFVKNSQYPNLRAHYMDIRTQEWNHSNETELNLLVEKLRVLQLILSYIFSLDRSFFGRLSIDRSIERRLKGDRSTDRRPEGDRSSSPPRGSTSHKVGSSDRRPEEVPSKKTVKKLEPNRNVKQSNKDPSMVSGTSPLKHSLFEYFIEKCETYRLPAGTESHKIKKQREYVEPEILQKVDEVFAELCYIGPAYLVDAIERDIKSISDGTLKPDEAESIAILRGYEKYVMDYYTILRLLRTYTPSKGKYSGRAKNAIIYTGDKHSETTRYVLERIGFLSINWNTKSVEKIDAIEKAGGGIREISKIPNFQCLDITDFKKPFFYIHRAEIAMKPIIEHFAHVYGITTDMALKVLRCCSLRVRWLPLRLIFPILEEQSKTKDDKAKKAAKLLITLGRRS